MRSTKSTKAVVVVVVTQQKHVARDGVEYATYDEMVEANKRRIKQRMVELGLDRPLPKPARPRASPSNSTGGSAQKRALRSKRPVRRSQRVKGEAPASNALLPRREMLNDSTPPVRRKKKHVKHQWKNQQLTLQERRKLPSAKDTSWLEELEVYLQDEEKISEQNLRSVMRQVKKLVHGEGITYHHWAEGVVFHPKRISLQDDFEELHAQAVDFENEHGRDLGNGWLVRHPITKLANFQHFRLQKNRKC